MAAYSPQLSTNVPYLNVFLIHQSRIHISLSLSHFTPTSIAGLTDLLLVTQSVLMSALCTTINITNLQTVVLHLQVSSLSKLLANDSIFITAEYYTSCTLELEKLSQ